MLSKTIEAALNHQLYIESWSSHIYLAMATFAETAGYPGTAEFLYEHSDEERMHMLKLLRYINERGGKAIVPALDKPKVSFKTVRGIIESLYQHEIEVTKAIHEVVDLCLKEKDYSTHNFMQWYVSEQLEEEALASDIMDRLNLLDNDNNGMYLFDRDIMNLRSANQNQ